MQTPGGPAENSLTSSPVSRSDDPLLVVIGDAQARAIQEALKPHLRAAGVSTVERRLKKTARFFQNARLRGSLSVRDLLAACAALELDPVELIRTALDGQTAAETRPPRIVGSAWQQLDRPDARGIGPAALAGLQAALQADPRGARTEIRQAIGHAGRDEVPLLLGLFGSALRLESDLPHAAVILRSAAEIARAADSPAAEADVLLRRSYLALEREQHTRAIQYAERTVVLFGRLDDREGEGRGYLARGTFQFYTRQYRDALRDFAAALDRSTVAPRLIAAHQGRAFCWLELDQVESARREVSAARQLTSQLPGWMEGNLFWLDARLAQGNERLRYFQMAQAQLCDRPADCAQVTVELIETALALGNDQVAFAEATGLCALVERNARNPRVQKAVTHLIRHRTQLTPKLVANIRGAIDRSRAERLAHLLNPEP